MTENYNKKEIGQRVKNIRTTLGLNMEEFGKKISPTATKGTISNWENGNYLPNNDRLRQIAELGNVSMSYLLDGTFRFKDIHMMPESERNKLSHGKSVFNEMGKDIKPSILAILNSEESLSDRDWYFLYMAVKFMTTFKYDHLIKTEIAVCLNALTEIFEGDIPSEYLESEVDNLSKDLSQLPFKILEMTK